MDGWQSVMDGWQSVMDGWQSVTDGRPSIMDGLAVHNLPIIMSEYDKTKWDWLTPFFRFCFVRK